MAQFLLMYNLMTSLSGVICENSVESIFLVQKISRCSISDSCKEQETTNRNYISTGMNDVSKALKPMICTVQFTSEFLGL